MGLYFYVFDESGEELAGVDVGSYADFNAFRDSVVATAEPETGTSYPVLINHFDSDVEWTSQEAPRLLDELTEISRVMQHHAPVPLGSDWTNQVAKTFSLTPKNVDGEPRVELSLNSRR